MKIEGVTIFEPSNSKGVFGVFYIIKKYYLFEKIINVSPDPFSTVSNRDIREIICNRRMYYLLVF
jgi:hypothetical protein